MKKMMFTEVLDVCHDEKLQFSCKKDEIISIKSAAYGHHDEGRCIKTPANDHLGCSNDVITLFTTWCSGRQSCDVTLVQNYELENANTQCPGYLKLYLIIDYSCHKGSQILFSLFLKVGVASKSEFIKFYKTCMFQ